MATDIRKQIVNTFSGGMNKDIDNSLRQPNVYLDAENMRLSVESDEDFGTIKNLDGFSAKTVSIGTDHKIVGYCFIRKYLVLFTTNNYNDAPDSGESHIYRLELDSKNEILSTTRIYADNIEDSAVNVDSSTLNFSTKNKIKAVGRWENDNLVKVYWCDNYNTTKFINIMEYGTVSGEVYHATDNKYKSASSFEFSPNVVLDQIELDSLISGYLKTGVVQYTYQYYSNNSSESEFAQLTNPIPITTASHNETTDIDFYGSLEEETSGMGLKLKIENSNTGFDRIRLVAVHYSTLNGTPDIRIVLEKSISTEAGTIYLEDVGQKIGEYTIEEISLPFNNIFISSDLEEKDNILFASNITEQYFDVDYDARAYRWSGSKLGAIFYNTNPFYNTEGTQRGVCKILDNEGNYYLNYGTDPSGDWLYHNSNGTPDDTKDLSDWEDIPEDFDCINTYNNPDNDGSAGYEDPTPYAHRFIYKSNGSIIGGEGPNVSYEFKVSPIVVDSGPPHWKATSNKSTSSSIVNSYTNYSNPSISSNIKGLARDEVYRCGIQFVDNKGRWSFVKWIGDIRTPKQSDIDGQYKIESDETFTSFYLKDDSTIAKVLYIEFTVSSLPNECVGYRIMYVKRAKEDRSILAQGYLSTCIPGTGSPIIYYPTRLDNQFNNYNIYRFISPEISFNKNLEFLQGDYLEICNFTPTASESVNEIWNYHKIHEGNAIFGTRTDLTSTAFNIRLAGDIREIEDGKFTTISSNNILVDDLLYNNYKGISTPDQTDPADITHYGGSCFVIKTESIVGFYPYVRNADGIYCVNYKRNVFNSQYGGNTYSSRLNNSYIPLSNFTDSSTVQALYGDTFLCFFEYLNLIADLSKDTSYSTNPELFDPETLPEVVVVPIETSINIPYQYSITLGKAASNGIANYRMLQEVSGEWEDGASTPNKLSQEKSLYQYNSVYSQQNIISTGFPKPLDFQDIVKYDSRVRNSRVKANNEASDSWTKFPTYDYIDVDSKYGAINNLVNFNNRLMFWQDEGFGILSVNERSLISDNNPGGLVLGTGGVLDRFDYVSKDVGNTNRYGLAKTLTSLYWLDNNKKELFKYVESLEPISSTKGVKSYLNKYHKIYDCNIGFDPEYNEVLFTIDGSIKAVAEEVSSIGDWDETLIVAKVDNFSIYRNLERLQLALRRLSINDIYENNILNNGAEDIVTIGSYDDPKGFTDEFVYPNLLSLEASNGTSIEEDDSFELYNKFTLSFNEPLNVFQSFNNATPTIYLNNNRKLFSHLYQGETGNLYLHNDNLPGLYYDQTPRISTLSMVINPEYSNTKVFDNATFKTSCKSKSGIDEFIETIDQIRFYNRYQNTDWKTLVYDTNIKKRDGHFSMAIPRNCVEGNVTESLSIFDPDNLDVTNKFKERMRDKYLIVDLLYNNDEELKLNLSYFITKYRISYR